MNRQHRQRRQRPRDCAVPGVNYGRPAVWQVLARAAPALACAWIALGLLLGSAETPAAASTPSSSPAVMILLDANHSLSGIAAAVRGAAQTYVGALPADVRVGLITFSNDQWQVVLRPTSDRNQIAAAINQARVAQEGPQSYYSSTGIYSALADAASVLLGAYPSRILVLSDAENLDGAAPSSNLATDVIRWNIDADDYVGKLQQLASTSDGRYSTPADAARLAVLAFPPASPHPTVSPASSHGAAHHGTVASLSGLPWALLGGIVAVFAALFAMAMVLFGGLARKGEGRDLATRIERYGPGRKPAAAAAERAGQETRKVGGVAVSLATRVIPAAAQDRLSKRLDLAGLTRQPGEWAILGGCAGLVIAAILSLVTSYVAIGIIGGAALGWLGMRVALSLLIVRRRATFSEQLPDVLQLIASSLQSGFSLPQALDAVVRQDNQPASGEFGRALAESRLGGKLEDALEAIANRMDSDDLRWTVMAIRIQQGVGGNLAEVLLTIVATMRERAFLRRQIHALSAEGRLSAYVLIALPVVVATWLFISSPGYMRPLYTTHSGELLLALAGVFLIVGWFTMRRMITIEV